MGARVVGCDSKVPEPRNSQKIKKLTTVIELSFFFFSGRNRVVEEALLSASIVLSEIIR